MRRFAMGVNAAAMAAAAVSHALWRSDLPAAALAAALVLWAAVELAIGLLRNYEGVVLRDTAVAIARLLWLASAVYTWLDARAGWTAVAIPDAAVLLLAALVAAGAGLRLWAVTALGASFSYDVKRPAGGALVGTGPYRLLRHPAYLGLTLASVPWGVAAGSLLGFAGLLLSTLVATVRRIQAEERLLQAELGQAWAEHARGRWRMVPYLY